MTTPPNTFGSKRHLLEIVVFIDQLAKTNHFAFDLIRKTQQADPTRQIMLFDFSIYWEIRRIVGERISGLCPTDMRKHALRVLDKIGRHIHGTRFIESLPLRNPPTISHDEMRTYATRALSTPRDKYIPDEIDAKLEEAERHDDGKAYDDVIEFFGLFGIHAEQRPIDFKIYGPPFFFTNETPLCLSPEHIAECINKMMQEPP